MPMTLLQWIASGRDPSPTMLFYGVRLLFYFFSIVYEDWALLELGSATMPSGGLLLAASSWVTWSIQTRSFSNSVETVILLWSLVFLQRIVGTKGPSLRNCILLAFFVVFGTFNRITFPAFLILPGISLLQHFIKFPLAFLAFTLPALFLTTSFILLDTHIYTQLPLSQINLTNIIITPLNNIVYNSSTENLSQHGLHPLYTHLLVNLPRLLGPALLLLPFNLDMKRLKSSIPLLSAVSGLTILSLIPHQEARFLIPIVPLILSSVSLPKEATWRKRWMVVWTAFNLVFGVLMGIYHQGGVVPAQLYLSGRNDVGTVVWWKTYKPPTWLLGVTSRNVDTVDLMGGKVDKIMNALKGVIKDKKCDRRAFVVAPLSAVALDRWVIGEHEDGKQEEMALRLVWSYGRHLNLDDMDFGDDGVTETVERVIGRRGIGVYEVEKAGCVGYTTPSNTGNGRLKGKKGGKGRARAKGDETAQKDL
ncbi:alpha 1,2 mannosyltransferase, variant 2 [Orbilia ellipsospora]